MQERNKYNIPSQVEDWDDLLSKFTQDEIVGMCDAYLRGRIRSKHTRDNQQAEYKEFKALKKAGQIPSNGR